MHVRVWDMHLIVGEYKDMQMTPTTIQKHRYTSVSSNGKNIRSKLKVL